MSLTVPVVLSTNATLVAGAGNVMFTANNVLLHFGVSNSQVQPPAAWHDCKPQHNEPVVVATGEFLWIKMSYFSTIGNTVAVSADTLLAS